MFAGMTTAPPTAPAAPHFHDVLDARHSRRGFLAGVAAGLVALPALTLRPDRAQARAPGFTAIEESVADAVRVPEGYGWQRLLTWGDPLFESVAEAVPARGAPFVLNRGEQEKRFGTCNDMIALFPGAWRYPWPSTNAGRMILCNNHEYVAPWVAVAAGPRGWNATAVEIEGMIAAIGCSVIALDHDPVEGTWKVVKDAAPGAGLNRRITPFSEVVFDGPAARHPWIVAASARVNAIEATRGTKRKRRDGVLCGTMANCAGGFTPWGTYLTAEENFNSQHFLSDPAAPAQVALADDKALAWDRKSFDIGDRWKLGGPDQFDLARSPHGPSMYGWIVEIDPYDPDWTPRKRTALGRKKNECATTVLCKDGRVAVYMGDDEPNEFVYKFVTRGRFDPRRREANRDLLSRGTLHAARFEADGTGRWLRLDLRAANAAGGGSGVAFADEGDMMVRAREAARRLGATPMDRPEDVESPVDGTFEGRGSVYVVCTANLTAEAVAGRPANPRRANAEGARERNHTGHIVHILEADGDHASEAFTWDMFAVGGDPSAASVPLPRQYGGATYNASNWVDGAPTTTGDRFANCDNITFDAQGNAWVATDGNRGSFPCNDGVFVMPTQGAGPRPVKRFLTAPVGAEVCGPLISPDQRSFFCAIQHPGMSAVGKGDYRGQPDGPFSTFPDGGWPRDAIIVVRRLDGGIVGT
jgi:secreted PhoX family phosphatase